MIKTILRYLIALIFIISGGVKAIDTVGFSFKLEEYFSASVFNLPFLETYALPIAIVVSAAEIILGLMLLMKIQLKRTLMLLIGLCVFFAFLTFYSAYFNKVTDCGCFGDAIKFTPWQSFVKDLVLLFGLVILCFTYRNSPKFERPAGCVKSPILWLGIFVTAFIIYWGNNHEPLVDFRDYKIGTDLIAERKKIEQNPDVFKTFYVLRNTKTNEEKKVNQDDYVKDQTLWAEGSPWQIQSDKTSSEIVKEGYVSEIKKFRIEDQNGNDIANEILMAPKVILLCTYKPNDVDPTLLANAEQKLKKLPLVYGISTQPNTFKTIQNLSMDATAMKTIARSNPFVLVLKNGKIVTKKSLQDFLND